MPAHWYWTSALPRSLLAALPLSLVGATVERRIRGLLLSVLAFIALYSILAHKEVRPLADADSLTGGLRPLLCCRIRVVRLRGSLSCPMPWAFSMVTSGLAIRRPVSVTPHSCGCHRRDVPAPVPVTQSVVPQVRFILPALPVFNIAAAAGLHSLLANWQKSRRRAALAGVAVLSVCCSALLVLIFAEASHYNYPGAYVHLLTICETQTATDCIIIHFCARGGTHLTAKRSSQ